MAVSRPVSVVFPVVMLVLGAGVVSGQNYPNKPIRIVTGAPGGNTDIVPRIISQGISGPLGQQVIIDNRGGIIPIEIVSKAPPDGYTLLFDGATFWIGPLMQETFYDPVRDFSPVTMPVSSPNVLVVHPGVAANSVKELIALAKAKPGQLNYAAGSIGATPHLAVELFKAVAGVNITRINYKGTGPAVNALIGGEVQMMVVNVGAATTHIKSGRLKALAVAGTQPSALTPGLPTVAATVPGYEVVSLYGLFAPAKTPAAVIRQLNHEIVRFLKTSEAKERFFAAGSEPVGSSPEELAATIKSERARLGKVIKDAGIRIE